MSAEDLAQLREQFSNLVTDSPTLKSLTTQLGRLVSHLESERRNRMKATELSSHHQVVLYGDQDDPAKPGLVFKVNAMWKWRQLLLGGASASMGALITLLVKHFFP